MAGSESDWYYEDDLFVVPRLTVGARVRTADGEGLIEQDEGGATPYKVRFGDREGWYAEHAVERAPLSQAGWFESGNNFSPQKYTQAEALRLCQANPAECLGYCFHKNQADRVVLKRHGTAAYKVPGGTAHANRREGPRTGEGLRTRKARGRLGSRSSGIWIM